MSANDYLLALYAVSGAIAIACALLPGASGNARVVCTVSGLGLIGWAAYAYYYNGWYLSSPVIVAVPLLLLLHGLLTLRRYLDAEPRQATAEPQVPLADLDPIPSGNQPFDDSGRLIERRRGPRRTLPGEFGSTPINQPPAAHDPWAALYASTERQSMRRGNQADHSGHSGHHGQSSHPEPGGHRDLPGHRAPAGNRRPAERGLPHVPRARRDAQPELDSPVVAGSGQEAGYPALPGSTPQSAWPVPPGVRLPGLPD